MADNFEDDDDELFSVIVDEECGKETITQKGEKKTPFQIWHWVITVMRNSAVLVCDPHITLIIFINMMKKKPIKE